MTYVKFQTGPARYDGNQINWNPCRIMSAPRHHSTEKPGRLVWRNAVRQAYVLFGVLALLLQLIAPSMSSAGTGDWMEICSEQGPVLVQIDFSGEAPTEVPCPKCETCALCVLNDTATDSPGAPERIQSFVVAQITRPAAQSLSANPAQFWPLGRGPPRGPHDITKRALRASIASIPKIGGAQWT